MILGLQAGVITEVGIMEVGGAALAAGPGRFK